MTQPQPTPGAPAPIPTPTPVAPAPAPTPAPASWSPEALPAEGKAWLDQQVAAARADADKKSRLGTIANAEKGITEKLAEALGLKPPADAPPTVESLGALVKDMQTRMDEAAQRAEAAELEATVGRLAARLGANTDALLDSRRFVDALNAIDATDDRSWSAAVEKVIGETLAANPGLRTGSAPAAPPASGVDFSGAGGTGQPITEAQLGQMTTAQIAAAAKAGQLRHLL